MRFSIAFALAAAAAAAQGLPSNGEKPCCSCDTSTGNVVCSALPEGQDECITTGAKCEIELAEEEYCCCCNPNRPNPPHEAIVCAPTPRGAGCNCPAVVCDIPWEPEWSETWIPYL